MERIPYTDGEYQAVCDFLIRLNRDDSLHLNWNWARFEWMMEHPAFDKSLRSSIGLWRSERRIVGAAIYDMYFGEAFCAVLPGYERLYPEILEDAFRRLRDEAGLAVAICEESPREIEAARSLGFQPADRTETLMRLSLERALPAVLPEGFSLVACDPERTDAKALAWMFWRGFDHGEDRTAFEADYAGAPGAVWRPHQKRELCLLALDRDGEYARLYRIQHEALSWTLTG